LVIIGTPLVIIGTLLVIIGTLLVVIDNPFAAGQATHVSRLIIICINYRLFKTTKP
jgi:uncharacterized membrane protein